MSLDIWLELPVDTGNPEVTTTRFYKANYTHNVIDMWSRAGVYHVLYMDEGRPAGDALPVLKAGLLHMEIYPDEYTSLNPKNGWGDYESAREFLARFIAACEEYPKTIISRSK